jgi:hypothetical protein
MTDLVDEQNAEVVQFPGPTTAEIPADKILENIKGKYTDIVVFGYSEDGGFHMHSSTPDADTVLGMVARGQHIILTLMTSEEIDSLT